jgi:pimeloyl-ACP methyl ester carboxylesterase
LKRYSGALIGIVLLVFVASCDIPEDTPGPPTETPYTSVPPSKTTSPIMPTAFNPESGNLNSQEFTPRAPSASDASLSLTVTPTPAPTEANIPVQFPIGDGLVIVGSYYGASIRPAPAILLIHALGSNKEAWRLFATELQLAGNNVLAIDLRGTGETGGSVDWFKAAQDIPSVLDRLHNLPGVDPSRVSIVGVDIGGSVALTACTATPLCKSVVLISPSLENQGLSISDTIVQYGNRPLLIAASQGDKASSADSSTLDKLAKGTHSLQLYDGTAHGMALLSAQSDLPGIIIEWLKVHNR